MIQKIPCQVVYLKKSRRRLLFSRIRRVCVCAEKSLNETADLVFYMLIGECKNLTFDILICLSKSTTGDFAYFGGHTPPKLEHTFRCHLKSHQILFFYLYNVCLLFTLWVQNLQKTKWNTTKNQQQRHKFTHQKITQTFFSSLFIHLVLANSHAKKTRSSQIKT